MSCKKLVILFCYLLHNNPHEQTAEKTFALTKKKKKKIVMTDE